MHSYLECLSEVMLVLVEKEGFRPEDPFANRILTHLQRHYDSIGNCQLGCLVDSAQPLNLKLRLEISFG